MYPDWVNFKSFLVLTSCARSISRMVGFFCRKCCYYQMSSGGLVRGGKEGIPGIRNQCIASRPFTKDAKWALFVWVSTNIKICWSQNIIGITVTPVSRVRGTIETNTVRKPGQFNNSHQWTHCGRVLTPAQCEVNYIYKTVSSDQCNLFQRQRKLDNVQLCETQI